MTSKTFGKVTIINTKKNPYSILLYNNKMSVKIKVQNASIVICLLFSTFSTPELPSDIISTY